MIVRKGDVPFGADWKRSRDLKVIKDFADLTNGIHGKVFISKAEIRTRFPERTH